MNAALAAYRTRRDAGVVLRRAEVQAWISAHRGVIAPGLVNAMDASQQWGYRGDGKTLRPANGFSVTTPRAKYMAQVARKRAGAAKRAAPAARTRPAEMTPEQLAAALQLARRDLARSWARVHELEDEQAQRFTVPGQQLAGGW